MKTGSVVGGKGVDSDSSHSFSTERPKQDSSWRREGSWKGAMGGKRENEGRGGYFFEEKNKILALKNVRDNGYVANG